MPDHKAANVIAVIPACASQTCQERRPAAGGHVGNAGLNAAENMPAPGTGTGASARRGASAAATPATLEIGTFPA